jgi:zinc protease
MIALLALAALAKPVPTPAPAPVAPPVPADPLAWRVEAPKPATPIDWRPEDPVQFTLSNGIPVTLVPRPDLPLVTVSLIVLGGRETNPAGKPGIAALTADLLDEGTKEHDAIELAGLADSLGASLATGAGANSSWASVSTLLETIEPSLDLLREVTREPAFKGKDFKRVQADTLVSLQQIGDDPNAIARRVYRQELFGADNPYGAIDAGTPESIGAATKADVKAYWKSHWAPGDLAIVVAGALDEAHAKTLLEARFGDWAGTATPAPALPAATDPASTRIVFVEKPGAVQSVLRVGHLGPLRTDPQWYTNDTMNALLGGMFSSRINLNLREAHGWTYGAFSQFSSGRQVGTFVSGASVQADATAPAVAEIVKEIRGMQAAAPDAAELATGKDALRLSLAGQFETNDQVAATWADLLGVGLPPDSLRTMPDKVAAVTADDVLAIAKANLHPDHLLIVVVGPKTATGDDGVAHDTVAELEKLGLGPVTTRGLW